jgi:RNA recognition motif-containing protein
MGTKLYVGNLPFNTTENELQEIFSQAGAVQEVTLMQDRFTGKSRGFAFVTMPNQDQATTAIAMLNGKEINGFAIKVNEAKPRESRGGQGRERAGSGYSSGNRFGSPAHGSGTGSSGGYNRSRPGAATDGKDLDIYDTKDGRKGGGRGRKGRGGAGHGSGDRSGGGRRSY